MITDDLMLCSKCQIYSGEDFVNFSGLLIKYELKRNNGDKFNMQSHFYASYKHPHKSH